MTSNRADYMRAYFLANKDRINANRRGKPKAPRSIDIGRKRNCKDPAASRERSLEKKRIMKEIEQMPHGPVWGGA